MYGTQVNVRRSCTPRVILQSLQSRYVFLPPEYKQSEEVVQSHSNEGKAPPRDIGQTLTCE
jgi:hypothetical protein